MVEFSEDFSTRLTDTPAIAQRVMYRLVVRQGEIPYFPGGLAVSEFVYGNDLSSSVRKVLSDFNVDVNVSGDRVSVGNIIVTVPGGFN